jgi:hypothetical protein
MVKSFANNSRRFSTARLLVLLLLLSCHCQAEEYEYEEEEEEYEEEHPPEFYAAEDVFSSWHIWDIYWWLECKVDHHSDANPDALPVHSAAAWQLLRQAYRETVGETESSLPPEEEDIDDDGRAARDGFQVPVQVVKMPERGRGNYVTEMVPEGTLVWSSKYTAQFTTAEQYRSFLRRLPPALACDVIVWAYTRWTTPDDTNAVACVDLDIGRCVRDAVFVIFVALLNLVTCLFCSIFKFGSHLFAVFYFSLTNHQLHQHGRYGRGMEYGFGDSWR